LLAFIDIFKLNFKLKLFHASLFIKIKRIINKINKILYQLLLSIVIIGKYIP